MKLNCDHMKFKSLGTFSNKIFEKEKANDLKPQHKSNVNINYGFYKNCVFY